MPKFNPFRKPQLGHDDPFKTKNPVPNELNWEDTYNFKPDDPEHVKALDQILEGMDKWEATREEAQAQDAMYQKGYNAAQVGEVADPQYADDPNYWMGYQDGRGDADLEEGELTSDPNFRLDGTFKSVEDVHNAVDKIFNERKASYYPVYVDGGTSFQCDVCHFTAASEIAAANHVRLAHQVAN